MYHCFVHCLSSFLCTIFSVLLIMFTDTLLPTFLSSMLAFFIGCWFTTISINSSGHNAFSHVHLISFLILEPVFLMQVLPVVIDVGTNNQQLLENPQYMGLQQRRLDGEEYTAIIGEFMEAVYTRWPRVIVQFEDFQNKWAFKLLQRYRNVYRVFNDDVQVSPYLVASVCWMLHMMIL
jgi:hypothetical protein